MKHSFSFKVSLSFAGCYLAFYFSPNASLNQNLEFYFVPLHFVFWCCYLVQKLNKMKSDFVWIFQYLSFLFFACTHQMSLLQLGSSSSYASSLRFFGHLNTKIWYLFSSMVHCFNIILIYLGLFHKGGANFPFELQKFWLILIWDKMFQTFL